MRKFPLGFWFFTLSVGFHSSLHAQIDTLALDEVQVEECYVEVITHDHSIHFDSLEYASYNTLDAGDFLNQNSVIYIKDYGPGSVSTLSYRGNSANHTRIFWEGMSVDNSQLGLTDMSLMNFGTSVEARMMKGAYSLNFASGGIGGILDIEQYPDLDQYQNKEKQVVFVRTGLQYGSFNTKTLPFDIGFVSKNKKLTFVSSVYYTESDNDFEFVNEANRNEIDNRENAAYRRFQWMPYLLIEPGERSSFKFSYWHLDSKREVPASMGANHGDASQYDLWNRFKVSYNYKGKKDKFILNASSMVLEDFMTYIKPVSLIDSRNKIRAWNNLIHSEYKLGQAWFSESQFRYDLQEAETNNYEELKQQDLISFYQSFRFQYWSSWFLKAGARIESFDGADPLILPSFSAGYMPNRRNSSMWLYFNAGINVRYPTFNERFWLSAGNPDLENEESVSGEISFDHTLIHRKKERPWNYRYIISAFYADVQNLIYWAPGADGIWTPQNVKAVQNSGIEIENEFMLNLKSWNNTFKVGYTYVDSRIQEDANNPEYTGNQQVYIPDHKLFLMFQVTKGRYFANYSQSYTGRVYINTDNSEFLPYSAPARLEFGRHFRFDKSRSVLSFRINNLFNEEYQYVVNMPMPLQNYTISFMYHIN